MVHPSSDLGSCGHSPWRCCAVAAGGLAYGFQVRRGPKALRQQCNAIHAGWYGLQWPRPFPVAKASFASAAAEASFRCCRSLPSLLCRTPLHEWEGALQLPCGGGQGAGFPTPGSHGCCWCFLWPRKRWHHVVGKPFGRDAGISRFRSGAKVVRAGWRDPFEVGPKILGSSKGKLVQVQLFEGPVCFDRWSEGWSEGWSSQTTKHDRRKWWDCRNVVGNFGLQSSFGTNVGLLGAAFGSNLRLPQDSSA